MPVSHPEEPSAHDLRHRSSCPNGAPTAVCHAHQQKHDSLGPYPIASPCRELQTRFSGNQATPATERSERWTSLCEDPYSSSRVAHRHTSPDGLSRKSMSATIRGNSLRRPWHSIRDSNYQFLPATERRTDRGIPH